MIRRHRRLRLAVAGLAALLTGLTPAWTAPGLAATRATPALYQELYRPQFHFTPAQNWMNDPNGLVYYQGEYHMFYQYNPHGTVWGTFPGGHPISRDLVHWTELPLAISYDEKETIFSGSVVVDKNNTSGFGTADNPPLVAIYTSAALPDYAQSQALAYSLDRGRTWTKYAGNPVLDNPDPDFRDPKVFFPSAASDRVQLFADGGTATVRSLSMWRMESIWWPDRIPGNE